MQAEAVLTALDFPRETSAQQAAACDSLVTILSRNGAAPRVTPFAAVPGRFAAAELCFVAAAVLLLGARRRTLLAAALLFVSAALGAIAGGLDPVLPHRTAFNAEVGCEPREAATRELWLTAHYDSKTEAFDHRGRSVVWALAAACGAAAVGFAIRRHPRAACRCGAAACLVAAASRGAWVVRPERSHGMVDNGAAVALLTELAARLQTEPLAHTRVRCVFLAAEEWGAQGSRAFAAGPLLPPRAALNLEAIGAGPECGVPRWEWSGRAWRAPDAGLRGAIAAAARARQLTVRDVALPVVTDCGPLQARGIAALTLLGLEAGGAAPHGLHTAHDRLQAVDRRGMDQARGLIWEWLRECDAAP